MTPLLYLLKHQLTKGWPEPLRVTDKDLLRGAPTKASLSTLGVQKLSKKLIVTRLGPVFEWDSSSMGRELEST